MPESNNKNPKEKKSLNIFGQPLTIFNVPVERDAIFSNHKGVYKSRIEKRQRKLIVKTTFINFYLHPDERIFCITKGYSPVSILEQVLTGLSFLYFKRAYLIFTDKRLLHIPLRYAQSPARSVSQILYEDCAKIWVKSRSLMVKYKNGQQEIFPYIGYREKKKIKVLLEDISLQPKEAGRLKARAYLCPGCTHTLPKDTRKCPACQLKFKAPLPAKILALCVPGGGYFYSRYTLLGIFIAAIEMMLMGFMIVSAIDLHQGLPINYALLAGLAGGLLLEKSIATYHAHMLVKDFMPAKKKIKIRKSALK